MAALACLKIHIFNVFFMAFHAFRNCPVGFMAFTAGQVCMSTGVLFKLVSLLRVACQAWICNVAFHFQIKRSMCIGMAAGAMLKFIVWCSAVAHTALRDSSGSAWRVLYVTVNTIDFSFVPSSPVINSCRLLRMALDTDIIC